MNIKTSICALVTLAGLSMPAFSAVVAGWDVTQFNATTATHPADPWFQTPHQLTSNLTYHGSIVGFNSPNDTITSGWTGSTVDLNNYIGFTMKADDGYELKLTSLQNSTWGTLDTGKWGYRIDNGTGFGSWNFSESFSLGNPGSTLREWDFADIETTGTVEFGFFAAGNNSPGLIAFSVDTGGYETMVNGTVAPVPEASTALLGSLVGLALLRRRR